MAKASGLHRANEMSQNTNMEVNQQLLNIITPAGIDFTDTNTNVGENYGKIYCISGYPADGVDFGWLAPLCNLEGTSATVEYRYTDAVLMIESMDRQISDLRASLEMAKKESEKKIYERRIQDLMDMISRISINNEPVGYVNVMLHIQDTDKRKLEERIKRVSARVQVSGCRIRLLKYKQKLALRCMSPYGIPNSLVSNIGDRIMPMTTFIGGFPMANSGINDQQGFYWAKTFSNNAVLLNMWLRNKDRTNSNWFITGVPGVGKSTALKVLFTKELAFGTKIILLDPEQEYIDLAKHKDIGGDVIDCTGGKNGIINPLQIVSKSPITDDKGELSSSLYMEKEDMESEESDLALHIQNLRLFFKLYFGEKEFDAGIATALERCLIEMYEESGITWGTDIHLLKNSDFPIMQDLYALVLKKVKSENLSDYEKNILNRLADLLYPIGMGADQFIWNGHTNLKTKSKFIVLNTSNLLEVDEKVKRAQFFNITSWAWGEMSKDRSEKVIFGVDEGYLFVDPEMIDLMKFLRNISKRDRKYEGGLMFITHSVNDVLDEKVKLYGQALIDNSCYKLVMGCDGKNLEETSKLLKLTEPEENILLAKNRGEGILFAGNVRVPIRIEVREKFLEMFGAAGGR
jgi:hypothetical protein